VPPLGRAGQSQAPLSCAAQGRHASRVASARTLGSAMRRRAVRQQEVRLRRELNSHDAAKPRTASQAQRRASVAQAPSADGLKGPRALRPGCESVNAPCNMRPSRSSGAKTWTPCATSLRRTLLETTRFQSVRGAAAVRVGAQGPGQASRRLKYVPRHCLRRGAGSTCSIPAGTTGFLAGWASVLTGTALPNPSLEKRPREACHPWAAQASRRLHYPARPKGGPPLGSPQLER
jgi:hypothetical protein